MIEVKCNDCAHTIETPEKYAGKRVRCPKCKGVVRVPGAVVKADSEQQGRIKFRCTSCNQLMGVGPEHAGKRVRCAKCKEPLQVPAALSQSEPPAVKAKTEDAWGGMGNMEDLLSAEANAPAVETQRPPSEPGGESDAHAGGLAERKISSGRPNKIRAWIFILVVCLVVISVGLVVSTVSSDFIDDEEFGPDVAKFIGFIWGVMIVLGLLQIISMWIVYEKGGQPGWASLVPYYNMWVLAGIGDKPGWLGIVCCFSGMIPFVGPVVALVIWAVILIGVAKAFDRGVGFGIGLTFLPYIFFPILAFSGD